VKNKLGICLIPSKDLNFTLKLALVVKEKGFDFLSISDYHKAGNSFAAFTKILENIKNITLGISVTNPILHSAWEIANLYVTLKKTYNEDIFLGIGTGDWFLINFFGLKVKEAINNLIESVTVIKKIFKKERVNVPIYLGAQGEKMLKLSMKLCDGVIINLANYDDISKALKIIEPLRKNKKVFVITQTYILENKKAIEEAKKSATIIYSGMGDKSVKLYGYDIEKRNKIRELLLKNKVKQAREMLSEKEVKRLTVCGDEKEFLERIKNLIELDIDKLILSLPMGKIQETILDKIINLVK